MSKLIDIKHPFQIKNIKSINEYLFILKNILRIVSQKGAREKPAGFNIPVRWSKLYDDFVVDFGSNKQRDVSGIHLDNLRFYFVLNSDMFNGINQILNDIKNCSNSKHIADMYKLKKNENRFLNFVVNKESIFCTGIYNRCKTSKRSGVYSPEKFKSVLIDDSFDFLNYLQQYFSFIQIQEKINKIENYNKIYLDFLEEIENLNLILKSGKNDDVVISFKKYINKELKKDKIEIKKYIQIINKEEHIDEDSVFWFLIYHITLMFNHKLLESLNSNKINDIIIHDAISNNQIKIVRKFNVVQNKKEKILNTPLMPVSF